MLHRAQQQVRHFNIRSNCIGQNLVESVRRVSARARGHELTCARLLPFSVLVSFLYDQNIQPH